MSKRVVRAPVRDGMVDPTQPGISFAQPKGGQAKDKGTERQHSLAPAGVERAPTPTKQPAAKKAAPKPKAARKSAGKLPAAAAKRPAAESAKAAAKRPRQSASAGASAGASREAYSTVVPPARQKRVAGKHFIVTGGTQGCGKCVALTLADEGAKGITICGRQDAKGRQVAAELERRGCRALFLKADLLSSDDCVRVVEEHERMFGVCDGLVHCAATTTRGTWKSVDEASADRDDFGGTDVELFDRVYALNVRAPFLLMQGVSKLMRQSGRGGSVVNIGSVHSAGGSPKLVAYATSKGALETMTKNFAYAHRNDRIRANYIACGWMYTDGVPPRHCWQMVHSSKRASNIVVDRGAQDDDCRRGAAGELDRGR